MTAHTKQAGQYMRAEIDEAAAVFARAAVVDHTQDVANLNLAEKRAIYTISRGSSDAAANILSYEFMRHLKIPVTSLPPSIFSLGQGVNMKDAAALVVSQSGASDDLVRSARGVVSGEGVVVAITNQNGSNVEAAAQVTLPINAGVELAVPATKTVIGSVATGMALLSSIIPSLETNHAESATAIASLMGVAHPQEDRIIQALLRAPHVYVIGRDTGFGAAQETALKLKECCAVHAEAYSSSEVLHGPLQLVTKPLLIIVLDTEEPSIQQSLDTAAARFVGAGGTVFRLKPSDVGLANLTPAAAAAALLCMIYPIVMKLALMLGHDPDQPATLSKVTQTT